MKKKNNNPEQYKAEGTQVTENIYLGADGKYHWFYEYRLMSNPVVLFTCLKVLAFSFLLVYLFVAFCTAYSTPASRLWQEIGELTIGFVCLTAFMMVLGTVSYTIWAGINGWKYCVLFEMDEKGITHTQMPKQVKKSEALARVLMLAGIATGNVGRAGQGLLIKGHSALSSSWQFVKSVEIIRRHNTIKVNERLCRNQIYANAADFDFVADYIKQHVSRKCRIRE